MCRHTNHCLKCSMMDITSGVLVDSRGNILCIRDTPCTSGFKSIVAIHVVVTSLYNSGDSNTNCWSAVKCIMIVQSSIFYTIVSESQRSAD